MRQFQIRQSPSLRVLNLSLYLVVIFTILMFADEIWLAGLLVLLVILLMMYDGLQLRSVNDHGPKAISLYADSGVIEIQHRDQCQRFKNFTLYLNRWFVILKLRDQDLSMNFLLTGERFGSITDYLSFRHQIVKMNKDQYVT